MIVSVLNNFHKNIKLAFEEKKDGKIPLLSSLLVQNNHYKVTPVYRKKTITCIYLN